MIKRKDKDSCLIYLADLVHNYASKGPHTFPINIGYIAAYAKKIYQDKIKIKLFKFPLDLIVSIKEKKPDILALSNYTWNLDINNRIIPWAKSLHEDIITVFGGPDYPITYEESTDYLKRTKDLDFYVLYQGEKGFANIIQRYFDSQSLVEMKSQELENCSFYDRNTNRVVASKKYIWIEDLDEIPSPYLTCILDEFFKDNLIPLIETNRGCPYSCTYCAWGKANQKKVFQFSLERVKKEVEYIAKKIGKTNLLMIGDANFGIFEKDVEIAKFLKYISKTYGYPKDLFVAWAKANPGRVIEIAQILSDMIGASSAFGSFQTTDPIVMNNIKRTNFSFGDFKKIQDVFIKKNISVSSELILGLPGETKESHLKGLRKLFDCNTQSIICYNLRMLGGSELNTAESRERFGIKTKFRLIDGGFGKYEGILSMETEEMVLKTSTMNMDEILYFRPIHFLVQFLWNYGYYKEPLSYLTSAGINPIDVIISMVENREKAPLSIKTILNDFIKESYDEWFNSREEIFEYYVRPENFENLKKGGFGKLNYKYTYKILLEHKNDFDEYLYGMLRDMLETRRPIALDAKEQIEDLFNYTRNISIDFRDFVNDRIKNKVIVFKYDILAWIKEHHQKSLKEFRSPGIKLRFSLPKEQAKALKELCSQFQGVDLNQTLRKMSEYINEKDLFNKVGYL